MTVTNAHKRNDPSGKTPLLLKRVGAWLIGVGVVTVLACEFDRVVEPPWPLPSAARSASDSSRNAVVTRVRKSPGISEINTCYSIGPRDITTPRTLKLDTIRLEPVNSGAPETGPARRFWFAEWDPQTRKRLRSVSCVLQSSDAALARAFARFAPDGTYESVMSLRADRLARDTAAGKNERVQELAPDEEHTESVPLAPAFGEALTEGVPLTTDTSVTVVPIVNIHRVEPSPTRPAGQSQWCSWWNYPSSNDIYCGGGGFLGRRCEFDGIDCWDCGDGCWLELNYWGEEYVDVHYECDCLEGETWDPDWQECLGQGETGGEGGGGPPVSGGGGSGTISMPPALTCDVTTLERGEEIRCVFSRTGTSAFSNIRWEFTPDAEFYYPLDPIRDTIAGPADSSVWQGVMAVGGTISVTADSSGGTTEPVTAQITVTPRSATSVGWFDSTLVVDATGLAVANVTTGLHLGLTGSNITANGTPHIAIAGGPNDGLRYYDNLGSIQIVHTIQINYAALEQNSSFHQRHIQQTPPLPLNPCPAGVITSISESGLKRMLEKHEGKDWDTGSHVGVRQKSLRDDKANIQSYYEGLVAQTTLSLANIFFYSVGYTVQAIVVDGVDPWALQLPDNCNLIGVVF